MLTKGVNRTQNTPPHTPRALSQHEPKKEPRPEPVEEPTPVVKASVDKVEKSSRSSSGQTSNQPPVSATKGTLSVNIVQGRGLRPSTAPYVVCIYQLNEDISDGPQGDAMDTRQEHEPDHDDDLAKGVAMRRMGSDQGKPMAIPGGLRSRQSSSTDVAKLRGNQPDKEVTEPVWNHEAVL